MVECAACDDIHLGSIDAQDAIPELTRLPVLLSHGTADTEDLPERTRAFFADALASGGALIVMDLEEQRQDAAKARLSAALQRSPRDVRMLIVAARTYATVNDLPAAERALKTVKSEKNTNVVKAIVCA